MSLWPWSNYYDICKYPALFPPPGEGFPHKFTVRLVLQVKNITPASCVHSGVQHPCMCTVCRFHSCMQIVKTASFWVLVCGLIILVLEKNHTPISEYTGDKEKKGCSKTDVKHHKDRSRKDRSDHSDRDIIF